MYIPQEEDIKRYNEKQAKDELRQYCKVVSSQEKVIDKLQKELEKLTNELGSNNQQVLLTAATLKNLQNMVFGDSSEKSKYDDDFEEEEIDDKKRKKKKRKKFGRKAQPDLPIQECNHYIAEEQLMNWSTGEKFEKWEGQFEVSEMINVFPLKFVLERHKRQKYKSQTGNIITAPGPLKLRAGNRYSIDFGIDVGISKYLYHHPLERYVREAGEYGLDVDSNTLFDQTDIIAWYLRSHVYEKIRDSINNYPVKMADETPWKNLGKKENNIKNKKFYMWGVRVPYAVYFKIYDSRSKKAAEDLLKGITGYLMCDGYSCYKEREGLILCHCWAHVRRKFKQAKLSSRKESIIFLNLIHKLYKVEDELEGKPPDQILLIRQEQSQLIVDQIKDKLLELGNQLPKSPLKRAINYALNMWKGLNVFLENPDVSLDNNGMERTIRGPVVGRKNYYGSKSLETAQVAAVWYSIIETCKANEVEPRFYIKRALTDILEGKTPPMPWEMSLKNDGFLES